VARFGYNGNGNGLITGERDNITVTLWSRSSAEVKYTNEVVIRGMGGWSIDAHHTLDITNRTLHTGTGQKRDVPLLSQTDTTGTITTVAGTGESASTGEGGQATLASLDTPVNVATGTDGSIYIREANRIRKIGTDGIITTVAGNGETETAGSASGDEGPATATSLSGGYGLSLGSDNSIYIADPVRNSIRRIGPDGNITTLASNLNGPYGVTWGGEVYFTEQGGLIRSVGADGKMHTYDDCEGAYLSFNSPHGIARLKSYSAIYVAVTGSNLIQRPRCNAITTAGNGDATYNGDFGSATGISLNSPEGVAVGPDKSVYIADTLNNRIRRVDQNGNLTTIAGNGNQGYNQDGISALSASLNKPTGLAVANDGSLYIADSANNRVRRVSFVPAKTYMVAAEDGSEVYIFDSAGRHLRTAHPLTGVSIYQFGYNANGLLISITDSNGNVTTIERDTSGNPAAIVAPFGQRTALTVDPNGYISSMANPAGETTQMTYTASGLLTSLTDPKGNASRFSYDSYGFLTKDQNAAGGFWALSQQTLSTGVSQVSMTSALGRTTTYLSEVLEGNRQTRTIISPTGSQTTQSITKDVEKTTSGDGTATQTSKAPDPRFAMQSPLTSTTITTPAGLSLSMTRRRSVSLSVASNILWTPKQTDYSIINGQTYTSVFDGTQNKFTQTSSAGRTATSLINNFGKPLSITPDPSLSPTTFSYDSYGRLTQTAQGDQLAIYSYDSSGRVASIADAQGNTSQLNYDLADRVKLLTLPSGRTYGFSYDANGNCTGITMPNGASHTLGYTVMNLDSTYTPPATTPYSWQYSLDKEWLRTILPGGRTVEAAYDSGGRALGIVYPEATVSLNYGDTTSRVTSSIRTPASGNTAQMTAFTYDGPLVTGATSSGMANGQFSYTYNNNFQISKIGFTSGSDTVVNAITRDNDGLVTTYGSFTFTRNGPGGATTRINDTANLQTTAQYSFLKTVDGPVASNWFKGNRSTRSKAPYYSLLARRTIASALLEKFELSGSTPLSKVTARKSKLPLLAMNDVITDTDAKVTLLAANLETTTVPLVREMTQADAEAALQAAKLVASETFKQCNPYYEPGQVSSQEPSAGETVEVNSYVFITICSSPTVVPDLVGMPREEAEAALKAANLTVGPEMFMTCSSDQAGMVVSQEPAAGGVVNPGSIVLLAICTTAVTVPDLAGMPQADAEAALKTANLTVGTKTYVTDNSAQPGTVISQQPAAGNYVDPNSAVSLVICSGHTGLDINMTYDSLGRLSTRTHAIDGNGIYSLQLSYDSRGNISQKTETAAGTTATWGYSYDSDGQLTSVTKNGTSEELYTYDVNGNRTGYQRTSGNTAATFDTQDRLVQMGGTTYTFNADGQLTQRGSDTFTYSAMGELLQATVSGKNISYAYDGMHRRVAATDGSGTYQYLYGNQGNPFQLTAMRDPSGVLTYYYYDDTAKLFAFDKGGVRYYVATDQVGTPKVVSNTTGAVVKYLEYDSYGMPTLASSPDFILPVGYAGGLTDTTTGLVRFGYRDYDPYAGRWTAKDPIFFEGGQGNLYQYVQNNPVNFIDPSGLKTLCEALREVAATSDSNPLLNGSKFKRSYLANEVIPGGDIDPTGNPGHFLHSSGTEYDIQYIQVGWSLTKTYGTFSPELAMGAWTFGGVFDAAWNWDWSGFSPRSQGANWRGLLLGEMGANRYKSFKDFVKAKCPHECK